MQQDGILVINKPAGITSHDVVAKLRKAYGMKKVGHTGTLDPMVDGVMVVAFGKATKLVQFMMDEGKVYDVGIQLGIATDTEDVTGTVVATQAITETLNVHIQRNVQETLQSFIGTYNQIPPMYAAIKINGKKLYEYARNNEVIERAPRKLRVFSIDYDEASYQYDESMSTFDFTVHGSKGLYVRTLCVDIGRKLGVPATMRTLTRIASGRYTIDDAHDLAAVVVNPPALIPLKDVQLSYPRVYVTEAIAMKLRQGYKLPHHLVEQSFGRGVLFAVYNELDGQLIGIYEQSEKYADKYAGRRIM